MAESTLSIINASLTKLGERRISSIEEDTPQGRAAKALHAQAFRYILTKSPWSSATEYTQLLSDATWSSTNSPRWPYRYQLPNKLVKLLKVYDGDEDQYYLYKRRGNYIYTDISLIYIEYIKDVTADNQIDPSLAQVLVCYLAYLLAPRLTKEESTTGRMYQEYQQALREAKASDAQQKGPLFYGPNAPVQGDYYEDHPDGWVDR